MKILKGGAIIDFYVNKNKFESYKTKVGQFNYVQRELHKILTKLTNVRVGGLEIRDMDITSNHFWGRDQFTFINDLGYSNSNKVALREDKLTLRIFEIDCIFVILEDEFNKFPTIQGKNYYITVSGIKII